MDSIAITVSNPSQTLLVDMPVTCGVPLPRGYCFDHNVLEVHLSKIRIASQFSVTSRWSDGSAHWLLMDCIVNVEPDSTTTLYVANPTESESENKAERQSDLDNATALMLPKLRVTPSDSVFQQVYVNEKLLIPFDLTDLVLVGEAGRAFNFEKSGEPEFHFGPVRSSILTQGHFVDKTSNKVIKLTICTEIYLKTLQATVSITLHNEAASKHENGMWDLGDEGSVCFKGLSLTLNAMKDHELICSMHEFETIAANREDFQISQYSSGAELTHSPIHVSADNSVVETLDGFTVKLSDIVVQKGRRSSPAIQMSSDQSCIAIVLHSFWENFPNAITRESDSLTIELFPETHPNGFELQGGEKKTHTLTFGQSIEDLRWVASGATVRVFPDVLMAADALQYLQTENPDRAMDALIRQGIVGPDNFFVKRERVDEYGWRHFGEVYADHEAAFHDSTEPFISHYNNQYDLIYGFLRMFLVGGEREWFKLGSELAEHVLDIDLYDTDEDRVEYNHGMFWHTDHYLPAHTSTHRSYSKRQQRDSDNPGGGGPGGEHCYTTGLKLYYFMTGSKRARVAVLKLAAWVECFYDGGGTLIEEIYRFLKSRVPVLIMVARGGVIPRHRYPIHRGIGYVIIAQLDVYEISGDRAYLEKAERFITGAIGPEDDLYERGLKNIEENWFYSIFLQAVIRYLDVKRRMHEYDATFFYARDSLIHYSNWIISEEVPYLDNPDVLEYPNHTWVAQDIRRCAILVDAYRYAEVENSVYLDHARKFSRYVITELESEPSSSYTRILAILMQNHGASALAQTTPERHVLPHPVPYTAILHTPHTIRSFISDDVKRLTAAIRRFSFQAEWKWFRLRIL